MAAGIINGDDIAFGDNELVACCSSVPDESDCSFSVPCPGDEDSEK